MRTDELRATLKEEAIEGEVCCGDEDEGIFDDDDFWEGLNIIEASLDQVDGVLKWGLTEGRRRLLVDLRNDMKQFLDMFIVYPESTK